MHRKSPHTTLQPLTMISIITQSLTHSHSPATGVNIAVNFIDDRQSTYERTLRGGRTLLLSFSLCMSHSRFTVVSHSFFHTPGISMRSMCIGACHACTASLCDLRDPGWGDPGFRHRDFFAWHPKVHPVTLWPCPFVFTMDDLLRTGHTSCLVITFQIDFDADSTDWFGAWWVCVVWFCFCFGLCCRFSVFGFVSARRAME